jgi:hypothetical protein
MPIKDLLDLRSVRSCEETEIFGKSASKMAYVFVIISLIVTLIGFFLMPFSLPLLISQLAIIGIGFLVIGYMCKNKPNFAFAALLLFLLLIILGTAIPLGAVIGASYVLTRKVLYK